MAKQYDHWDTVNDVGEGGQANVYLVQSQTGDPAGQFALKRLRNLNRIERFRNEVEAAQKLSHPGVVKIVHLNLAPPRPYIVMPYYDKGNAERAGVPLWPVEKKFTFFRGVVAALEHAHEHGVIHRDLKPENILVKDDDTPIVSDFGICYIDGGARFTTTYEAVGPRDYIPPEAESGRVDEVSKTFDVYMLGKVLYWILAGRDLPRERHRQPNFDLALRFNEPKFEAVNELLDHMIVEDPAGRLHDAKAVAERFAHLESQWSRMVNFPSSKAVQRCIYCGTGTYAPLGAEEPDGATRGIAGDTGVTEYSGTRVRAVQCDNCGNIQFLNINGLLRRKNGRNPWARK